MKLLSVSFRARYKDPMNAKVFLVSLAATTASFCAVSGEVPAATGVILIGHEKVATTFAQGGPLISTNNFKVQAGHRTGPGEVEIHDQDTDIFYIQEGSATFVTGGKAQGTKVVAPGETRAKEIIGGEAHHLTKGDVIIIPKGVPHWFKEVDGRFDYFVVKVSK